MEDTLDLDADLTINLGNNKEVTVNVDASFGGINGWTFNGTAAHTSFSEAVLLSKRLAPTGRIQATRLFL